jgi:GTP pyrophosphokinase
MFNENYLDLRKKAFQLLEEKFPNEMRFSSAIKNQPYWTHLLNVHNYLITYGETDENVLIAALLHDAVEDSDISVSYLSLNFNAEIAKIVELLSKPSNYEDCDADIFYTNILKSKNVGALKIKVFDRIDNLLTNMAFNSDIIKVQKYINETEKYFRPIAEKVGLEIYLDSVIVYLKKNL